MAALSTATGEGGETQRPLREKARMPGSEERGPTLKGGDEWPKWLFLRRSPVREHGVLHHGLPGHCEFVLWGEIIGATMGTQCRLSGRTQE
jgi:hypothetical protein